ncbi:MAG TPA: endonuclease/exonuclease/phosphatase family protein, partial [Jiangellaceae bacterium]|nr:endonuclease/exonuclease/phosphatase family protein [Jiangellaceae bacterium]
LTARLDGTWHTALADPDGRGIRVGVLSRRAMTEVEQVRAFPGRLAPVQVDDDGTTISELGRPALRVRVHGEVSVDVISVHLKSKLLTFPGGRFNPRDEDERARYAVYALHRRAAEAAGVRSYVTGILEGEGRQRPVVVAGDLNDEAQAGTTQILLGPPGSEIGTAGYNQPDSGEGARLWNLAGQIPEAERYSRIYRGRRELIDHLLVSHALRDAVAAVTTGLVELPSITDNPVAQRNHSGSDHRPVIATLNA